jgi:hypothetical protein
MTTYQHTPEDADAAGYLPYDGQGRPISRADADRIIASAPAQADPEELEDPSTVSLDYIRRIP